MSHLIGATILFFATLFPQQATPAQSARPPQATPAPPAQTAQPSQGSQPPKAQTPPPAAGQRGTPPKQPAKPVPPLTLRQVIESLSSLRNSSRVEDLISKRGVQFQASPGVLDILKEFGAGPKLLSMIPVPPSPPPPAAAPSVKPAGALTVICEPKDCAVIVNDTYQGTTSELRKTVTGLRAGEATVEVFANGYD